MMAAELPFRMAYRAFTAAGEVRVFDGRSLWVRSQDDGRWRPQDLPTMGHLFDVSGRGDRLYLLDEGGVAVVTGEGTPQRLPICSAAGSLAVASGTIWCASPANALGKVEVKQYALDGKEVNRWTVRVPEPDDKTRLAEIARLARAWWFLLADDQGAVGVSLNRPQLLVVPARGEARVVPWLSPLEALRLRLAEGQGTQPRLPELHLRAALLLPGGDLLLLPGITDVDSHDAVSQADRLLIVTRDARLEQTLPLPRRAEGIVSDPAGPLILYENNTLQPLRELQVNSASATTSR